MKKMILHGEVAFYEVTDIPNLAVKLNIKEGHYVVGESETHGNDHRIVLDERTDVFTLEDQIFLKSIGTEIYCPNETRHDTIELPEGTWKVGHASEYDYFTEELNRVRD